MWHFITFDNWLPPGWHTSIYTVISNERAQPATASGPSCVRVPSSLCGNSVKKKKTLRRGLRSVTSELHGIQTCNWIACKMSWMGFCVCYWLVYNGIVCSLFLRLSSGCKLAANAFDMEINLCSSCCCFLLYKGKGNPPNCKWNRLNIFPRYSIVGALNMELITTNTISYFKKFC